MHLKYFDVVASFLNLNSSGKSLSHEHQMFPLGLKCALTKYVLLTFKRHNTLWVLNKLPKQFKATLCQTDTTRPQTHTGRAGIATATETPKIIDFLSEIHLSTRVGTYTCTITELLLHSIWAPSIGNSSLAPQMQSVSASLTHLTTSPCCPKKRRKLENGKSFVQNSFSATALAATTSGILGQPTFPIWTT